MDAKEKISAFIATELLNGELVDEEENLLAEGMVDSLGMLRVVAFIQDSFKVQIPPEHFVIENFRTVGAMARYLQRLLTDGA